MTAYVNKQEMGDRVFGLLATSDPTLDEACAQLDITPAQFRRGLAFVKDVLATDRGSPVTYDPQTWRYSLALSTEDQRVRDYESYRLRIALKQLKRLYTGTAEPAATLFPHNVTVRRFKRHLEGAVEELELLLSEVGS
jgi:hypothetical protein